MFTTPKTRFGSGRGKNPPGIRCGGVKVTSTGCRLLAGQPFGKKPLIFFDGTYRLQRQGDAPPDTEEKWACSWRLRILDLSMHQPEIKHLKPYVVVATQTGEGIFKTTCAESLGNRVCRDFKLDINQTLWIEHFPGDPDRMYVAVFSPRSYFGTQIFYDIAWRPIRPNEIKTIKPFIPECEGLSEA